MKAYLVALFLQVPTEEAPRPPLRVEVKQKTPQVRVEVRADPLPPGQAPILRVRHRVTTMFGLALDEVGVEEIHRMATSPRGELAAGVTLAKPGVYEFSLGVFPPVRMAISRTGFGGWDAELGKLRKVIQKLSEIAVEIDKVSSPSDGEIARWRGRLLGEKTTLTRLRTEFTASELALQHAFDGVYYHPKLLGMDFGGNADLLESYGTSTSKFHTASDPTFEHVAELSDVVLREGALKILEELGLLLAEHKEEIRVMRWDERGEAWEELEKARAALGEYPEVEWLPEIKALIEEARQGTSDPEMLRVRIQSVRQELFARWKDQRMDKRERAISEREKSKNP
jgi:hypothetical protein